MKLTKKQSSLILFFILILSFNSINLKQEHDPEEITSYVYMKIKIGQTQEGKVIIGLFGKTVPKTADNFLGICLENRGKDEDGNVITYKGSKFHRIITDYIIQGGEIGAKIEAFEDENFIIKHSGSGYVSMANAGPNTNDTQFFFTLRSLPGLDGKHTVFGKIVSGMTFVNEMNKAELDESDKPLIDITITECGEDLEFEKKQKKEMEKPLIDDDFLEYYCTQEDRDSDYCSSYLTNSYYFVCAKELITNNSVIYDTREVACKNYNVYKVHKDLCPEDVQYFKDVNSYSCFDQDNKNDSSDRGVLCGISPKFGYSLFNTVKEACDSEAYLVYEKVCPK